MKVEINSIYAVVAPSASEEAMQGNTVLRHIGGRPQLCWKEGTIIDHPRAWQLVGRGLAKPADEEAEAKCRSLTPEVIAEARFAQEMFYAGIPLHAKRAYRAGVVDRYDPITDSYSPGVNVELIDEDSHGLQPDEVAKLKEQISASVD